jgi:hypothetical protein
MLGPPGGREPGLVSEAAANALWLTNVEESFDADSSFIPREFDDQRDRVCFCVIRCPHYRANAGPNGEDIPICTARSFKNAYAKSYLGEENAKNIVIKHLTNSGLHELTTEEAAYYAETCEFREDLETFAMREEYRVGLEKQQEVARQGREDHRKRVREGHQGDGRDGPYGKGGKGKKGGKVKGKDKKGKHKGKGSDKDKNNKDSNDDGWAADSWAGDDWEADGWWDADALAQAPQSPPLRGVDLAIANAYAPSALARDALALPFEVDQVTAGRFRMIYDSLERARQASLAMERLCNAVCTQRRAEADAAGHSAASFNTEALVLAAAKELVMDIIRLSV